MKRVHRNTTNKGRLYENFNEWNGQIEDIANEMKDAKYCIVNFYTSKKKSSVKSDFVISHFRIDKWECQIFVGGKNITTALTISWDEIAKIDHVYEEWYDITLKDGNIINITPKIV